MSNPNVKITGSAYFKDNTINLGVVDYAKFSNYAVNNGIVKEAGFTDSSTNIGTISAEGHFFDTALNKGTSLTKTNFFNSSKNLSGTLYGESYFSDTSENNFLAYNKVQFSLSALNTGTVQGSATFLNKAQNTITGTVSGYGYFEPGTNLGFVIGVSAANIRNGFYEDDFGYRYINGTRYNILNVNAFTISHYYATDVTGTIPKILAGSRFVYYKPLVQYQDTLRYFIITSVNPTTSADFPLVHNQRTSKGYLVNGKLDPSYEDTTISRTFDYDVINHEPRGGNLVSRQGGLGARLPFFGFFKAGKFVPAQDANLDNKGRPKLGPYSDFYYNVDSIFGDNAGDAAYYVWPTYNAHTSFTTRFEIDSIINAVFQSLDDNKYRVYSENPLNNNKITAYGLATGLYSYGYFLSGEFDVTKTSMTPSSAIDASSRYYTYNSGRTTGANGYYSNVKIQDGIKQTNYSGYGQALDNSKGYYYTAGNAVSFATGSFTFGSFDVNGDLNTAFSSSTPISATDLPTHYYTYNNGTAAAAQNYYSNGYFVDGVKTTTTNQITAKDNGYLYSYSGTTVSSPSLSTSVYNGKYFYQSAPRTGAFYDGYFLNGYIDNTQTLLTLGTYNDAGSAAPYNYAAGVASTFRGEFDNRAWIDSQLAPNHFNGENYRYFNGNIDYATVLTPVSGSYLDSYYVYTSGAAALANGAYSNGYFVNGTPDYTERTLPLSAADNRLWYLYPGSDNTPDLADGEYGGIIYASGFSLLGAYGPYSVGYISNGAIDTAVTLTNPVSAIDNSLFYTYLTGAPTIANGAYPDNTGYVSGNRAEGKYSFGKYINGFKDVSYNGVYTYGPEPVEGYSNYTPLYTYLSGDATLFTGTGRYQVGYVDAGAVILTSTNLTPALLDLDLDGLYYFYDASIGVSPILAQGQYTIGYYVSGSLVSDYTNTRPESNLDEVGGSFYTASNGVFTLYTGTELYSDYYFVNGMPSNGNYNAGIAVDTGTWYEYDLDGIASEVVLSEGQGKTYNNVRLINDGTDIIVDTAYTTTGLYEELFVGVYNNSTDRYVKIINGYSAPDTDNQFLLTTQGALTGIYAPLLPYLSGGTYQIHDATYVNWGPVVPVNGTYEEPYYYNGEEYATIRVKLSNDRDTNCGSLINYIEVYATFLWTKTSELTSVDFFSMNNDSSWANESELTDLTPHLYANARPYLDGVFNDTIGLSSLYFVIQNGRGVLANGVYTNNRFIAGETSNEFADGYYETLDVPGTYRHIQNTGTTFGIPAAGAYSFGYLTNAGAIDITYTSYDPQTTIDTSESYVYANGVGTPAGSLTGFFSVKLLSGTVDTEYDSAYDARDDVDGYSKYVAGIAYVTDDVIYAIDGVYSNSNSSLNYSYLSGGDNNLHSVFGNVTVWMYYGTTPGEVTIPQAGIELPAEGQINLPPVEENVPVDDIMFVNVTIGGYKKITNGYGGMGNSNIKTYYSGLLATDQGYNLYGNGDNTYYKCPVTGTLIETGDHTVYVSQLAETFVVGTYGTYHNGSCGTYSEDDYTVADGDTLGENSCAVYIFVYPDSASEELKCGPYGAVVSQENIDVTVTETSQTFTVGTAGVYADGCCGTYSSDNYTIADGALLTEDETNFYNYSHPASYTAVPK